MVKPGFEKLKYSHFQFCNNESFPTCYGAQIWRYFINLTGFVRQSSYCELLSCKIKSSLEGFHPKYLRQVIYKKGVERPNVIKK